MKSSGINRKSNIIICMMLVTMTFITIPCTNEAISSEAISPNDFGFVGHIPLRGYCSSGQYYQYPPGTTEPCINAPIWTEVDNWRNAGTGIIRFDWFAWHEIEKGNNNWKFDEFDYLVNLVDQSNIEMEGLLAYGNSMKGCNPRDENNFEFCLFKPQYLEYIRQVVARYDGDNDLDNDGIPDTPEDMPNIKYWEVWNEPFEYGGFWEAGTAEQYAEILAAAYDIIKSTNPDAKILFAGVGTAPHWIRFIEDVLQYLTSNNYGECFDILPIHTSYVDTSLEAEILSRLRLLLSIYGFHPIIWANEVGCAGSYWKGEIPHGYSYWHDKLSEEDPEWDVIWFPYEEQVSHIAKRLITDFSEGITKVFPYMSADDAKSEVQDPPASKYAYPGLMYDYYKPPSEVPDEGLIGEQWIPFPFGKPKPALFAYTQAARKLQGLIPDKVLYEGDFYAYSFRSQGSQPSLYRTVLWDQSPEDRRIPLHTNSLAVKKINIAHRSLPLDNSFKSDEFSDYWWTESSSGNQVIRTDEKASLHGDYSVKIVYNGNGWAWVEPSGKVSKKIDWKPQTTGYKVVFYVQLDQDTKIDIGFNERYNDGTWATSHDNIWSDIIEVYNGPPPPPSDLDFHLVYDKGGNPWYRIEAEFSTPSLTKGDYLQFKIGAIGPGQRTFLVDEVYFVSEDGRFILDEDISDLKIDQNGDLTVSIGLSPVYLESDQPIEIRWEEMKHLSLRYLMDKDYIIGPREHGIYFVRGGETGKEDLQACIKTEGSLHFDIHDDLADRVRNQAGLDVIISYYDNGNGGFKINYGGSYTPSCVEAATDLSEYQWCECHYFINDAPLDNRLGNFDSDFEIIAQNGEIAIRSVEVFVAKKTETGIENLLTRDPALKTFTYDGKSWFSPAWSVERGEGNVNTYQIRTPGPLDDSRAIEMIFTGEKWLWFDTSPRSSILTVLEPDKLYTLTFYARYIWGDNKISIGFNKPYKNGFWGDCVDNIWVGKIPKDFQWHQYTVLLRTPTFDPEEHYLQLKIGVYSGLTESWEIFELSMVGITPAIQFEDPSLEDRGEHWGFETGGVNSGVFSSTYVAFDGSFVTEMSYTGSKWLWIEPRSSQDVLTHLEPGATYRMIFHAKLEEDSIGNVISVGFNKRRDGNWLTCLDNVWAGIIPRESGPGKDGWWRFEVPVKVPNWDVDWSAEEWIQPKIGVVHTIATDREHFLLDMIGDDPLIHVKDPSLEEWTDSNDLEYWAEERAGGDISRTGNLNDVYHGDYAALMNFMGPEQDRPWLWLDTGDASSILNNLRPNMRYNVVFHAKYKSGDNMISVGFNRLNSDGSWAGCTDNIWIGAIPKYQGFENRWFEFKVHVTTPDYDPNTQYLQLKIGTKGDITDSAEEFILDLVAPRVAKAPIIRLEEGDNGR